MSNDRLELKKEVAEAEAELRRVDPVRFKSYVEASEAGNWDMKKKLAMLEEMIREANKRIASCPECDSCGEILPIEKSEHFRQYVQEHKLDKLAQKRIIMQSYLDRGAR